MKQRRFNITLIVKPVAHCIVTTELQRQMRVHSHSATSSRDLMDPVTRPAHEPFMVLNINTVFSHNLADSILR